MGRGEGWGHKKIKSNTQSDMNARLATARWWKHDTVFDEICSPQHTDGKWTGRERERTDGQTHKQRADSTPHSALQSHCGEVGSGDWRGNNDLCMPSVFQKSQFWPFRERKALGNGERTTAVQENRHLKG